MHVFRPRSCTPLLIALFVKAAAGQTDWPTYGHDSGSTRYSPLKQITTKNVSKLAPAWVYRIWSYVQLHRLLAAAAAGRGAGRGGGRARASEATPIVVKGVMYLPTPNGRVVALEPETGNPVWSYEIKDGNASTRGVEYWGGDTGAPPMIVFGTTAGQLIGLNAVTGKPVPGFGAEGFVNMRQGIENGFPSGQFSLSSPPKVYKNLVITGARVQESPSLGYAGDTRAWDLHTGKLLWHSTRCPPRRDRPRDLGRRRLDQPLRQ